MSRPRLVHLARGHRVVSAAAGAIAAGLGGQLLLLVSGPLVARMLGVDGRGYLAGLNLWPLLLALLGNLGIPAALTYFLTQRPRSARALVGEAYRIAGLQAAILSALLAAILLAWSAGKPAEVRLAVWPTLTVLPAMLAQQYALGILQGERRFAAFNLLRLLPTAVYVACVIVLFVAGAHGFFTIVLATTVSFVAPSLVTTAFALARIRPAWEREPGMRRALLGFGVRGHLGAVSPVDSLRVDQAIVAIFLSPAALGLYVVAYAFTNLPRFLAESVGKVAYPVIADRRGTAEAPRLFWRFFWVVTLLNLPLTVALVAALPWLVHVCFGADFAAATPIARVLLVGTTFVASRRILVEGLRGFGLPGTSTVAELVMYPWLALAGPPAMARAGALGLAQALSAGYAISLAIALVAAWLAVPGRNVPADDLPVAGSDGAMVEVRPERSAC